MGTSVAVAAALTLLLVASARAATPAAGWTVDAFAEPTNFSSSMADTYTVTARNAGSVATTGEPVTLSDALPAGLVPGQVEFSTEGSSAQSREDLNSDCTSVPLQCTFPGPVAPDQTLRMIVSVSGVGGTQSLVNVATVSGGGAPQASARTSTPLGTAAPSFGVASFEANLAGLDGIADTQAGGHPYELTATIALNNAFSIGPEGALADASVQDVRDFVLELPLGLLAGAAQAPTCTFAQLASRMGGGCPPDTAIGQIRTEPVGPQELDAQIYNMVPEQGFPAEFGYVDPLTGTHALYASVAPTPAGYVLRLTANQLPEVALTALYVTFFGDPAAKDGSGDSPQALLTNPPNCSGQPLAMSVHLDSWENPGEWIEDGKVLAVPNGSEAVPLLTGPGWVQASTESPAVTGCEALAGLFAPSIATVPQRLQAASPTAVEPNRAADSPAGLELELKSPASESPEADATPPLRRAVVTLPEGLTVDPSAGDGLQACSIAQIGWLGPEGPGGEPLPNKGLTNFTPQAPECPEGSKVGSLELTTPLFAGVLSGSLYLAAQNENPFGSALAAYAAVDDPATGVVLKLPAELRADPRSGRLTVVLEETPQLPFSDLKLRFFSGPRALLATPDGCGTHTTTSELTPWSTLPGGTTSSGSETTHPANGFTIDEGCMGGFAPSFTAGVTNLQAGGDSSLVVSFSRGDADQELGAWSVSLPPGLLADIGSVPLCTEAAANAGTCSEASRVGTVLVGAGPGPDPLFTPGKAYLTGPYNGGPFGLSVVVPVIAGPLDLGTVVVRQSLRIDQSTAQITDVSDPFPTVLDVTGANGQTDGIPIRLRRVDVTLERPGGSGGAPFIFNPTSCEELGVTGNISSVQGTSAPVESPFQVTGCKGLKFTPKLTAVTRANGELAGHGASLHLAIASPAAQANLRSLKLDLPQRLPARLETIQRACPESTFDVNPATCPKASVVGSASVQTPILSTTMTGPAYLVSKNGTGVAHPGESKTEKEEAAFPDLVLVLQGEGVRIDLTGALFVSAKNITSVTFRTIPDVPIRRLDLVLPEGKGSILAASAGLCTKRALSMTIAITGQNGAKVKPGVTVGVSGCKKPKRHEQSGQKRRATKK